jgi:hypothetical protein
MASDHGKVSNTGASSTVGTRKPYVKPAFRHEKVFETMALACGKISATQSSCRTNRKNS